MNIKEYLEKFMDRLVGKHPAQPEFHQAVREVTETLGPCLKRHPEYLEGKILSD